MVLDSRGLNYLPNFLLLFKSSGFILQSTVIIIIIVVVVVVVGGGGGGGVVISIINSRNRKSSSFVTLSRHEKVFRKLEKTWIVETIEMMKEIAKY